MTRTQIILFNLISWVVGILVLWLGSLALNHVLRPGIVRTAFDFVLLGLVVTIFGGTYGLLQRKGAAASRSGL